MKANELRIYNLVGTEDGRVFQVTSIGEKGLNGNGCASAVIYGTSTPTYFIDNDFSKLKPISLTEEWLLKFGFEFSYDSWTKIFGNKSCFDIRRYINGKLHFICNSGDSDTHLIYTHQLQNLYFAITGTELTIST